MTTREAIEESTEPARVRRGLALGLGTAGLLLVVFWLVASDAGWLMDAPFDYRGRPMYTPNLVVSVGRFLTPAESALSVLAALLLLPALVFAATALGRHRHSDPLEATAERILG